MRYKKRDLLGATLATVTATATPTSAAEIDEIATNTSTPTPTNSDYIRLDVLVASFKQNYLEANANYVGRVINILSKVSHVGVENGKPYVALRSPVGNSSRILSWCLLVENYNTTVVHSLRRNMSVVVTGKLERYHTEHEQVAISNCSVALASTLEPEATKTPKPTHTPLPYPIRTVESLFALNFVSSVFKEPKTIVEGKVVKIEQTETRLVVILRSPNANVRGFVHCIMSGVSLCKLAKHIGYGNKRIVGTFVKPKPNFYNLIMSSCQPV